MYWSNIHINKFLLKFLTFFVLAIFFPVIVSAQYKEVIAEKGEGIYRLLTRNGLSVSKYMDAFIQLNQEQLGDGNILFTGVKYKLPREYAGSVSAKSVKTVTYDIFGKNYSKVAVLSEQLNGAVFYLVAGHGGPDPGAVGIYGNHKLCEDEYAYDVTLRLARNLIQNGATVYMIIRDNDGIRDESYLYADKDEKCYPNYGIPVNHLRRLRQRTDAVNSLYKKYKGRYQRMIAIHLDSRSHGENIDVFFYHDSRSDAGRNAAITLKKTFQKKYDQHQPGRGYHGTVSSRNLYVIRNTYPVAIYIELGNINHYRDQQRFIQANNRQALANWLTEGLITDFKTNK
jgi:N-acetylmuramoyl-L-alanine amidase